MDSKKVLKLLLKDGWIIKRTKGSHHHLIHPQKRGVVTVPHPKKDLPAGTLKSIEKQADLKLER